LQQKTDSFITGKDDNTARNGAFEKYAHTVLHCVMLWPQWWSTRWEGAEHKGLTTKQCTSSSELSMLLSMANNRCMAVGPAAWAKLAAMVGAWWHD